MRLRGRGVRTNDQLASERRWRGPLDRHDSRTIRGKIKEAARQLKPLAERGMPLAVVIANPQNAPVVLGDQEIVWAMYGDPVVRVFASSRGPIGGPVFMADRNGKLTGDHHDGSYPVVSVYKTASATATPLPNMIFDGPHDRVFEFDPVRGRMIHVA